MQKRIEPLPREEVIKAVERKNPSRVPLFLAKWWGEGFVELHGDRLGRFDKYPEDTAFLFLVNPATPERMNLPWEVKAGKAHDSACVIDDWAKLDDFIERLPAPEDNPEFDALAAAAEEAHRQDRYILFGCWNLFFERPWMLRGMENLLCDYYAEPDKVHKLHAALGGMYCDYIEAAVDRYGIDGFWTSDDLGHQSGPMMSPEIFHELIFPYYKQVGDTLHGLGVHFWLHSCGDNTPLLPDLTAAGVDIFHPVQKYTMDEAAVAREFGDRLSFLAGIDVQHTLQEMDPQGVREEVRFLIDTFDRPDGGMCIAAGNGILPGTPLENVEAFLDEAVTYGRRHREQYRK